jgi:hypothetical protein
MVIRILSVESTLKPLQDYLLFELPCINKVLFLCASLLTLVMDVFGIYMQLWSLLHKQEGLAMIDDGHRDGKRRYWFPCATLSSDSIGADAKS